MAIVDKIIDVLDSFVVRPIGVYNKDYRFMVEHLDRNIGNHELEYSDGYSTPIGQLSNPYYNAQIGKTPWFFADSDKAQVANYLDYIALTYNSTDGITSINEKVSFPTDLDSIKVGKISGSKLNDVLSSSDEYPSVNPNDDVKDTKLGKESGYFVKQALKLSIKENDKHNAKKFSISKSMGEYFGLNTDAYNNGILTKYVAPNEKTGRYEDFSPLDSNISPVYTTSSKWGNYKGLGVYEEFYKSTPSVTTMSYINDNIGKNKYKPNLPDESNNLNYLDSMKIAVGKSTDYNGSEIRYIFNTLHTSDTVYNNEGHTTGSLIGGLKAYGEQEAGSTHSYKFKTFNSGVNFGKYSTFDTDPIGVDDLLNKTNQGFMKGKYDTLVARFHTSTDYPNDDLMSSSVSKAYGMSHGRNLLRGDAKNGKTFTSTDVGNGYDNPYCRVWTYHHQYHRMKDAIRPFATDEPDGSSPMTPKEMQDRYNFGAFRTGDLYGLGSGGERLTKYGVLGYKTNAGLVNIAPKKGVDIKSCMFSIENLAWKGMFTPGSKTYETNGLSAEQKGPFGGRIMWFPPYDIKFSENVTANWANTSFIGRGEDIYTYTNTSRDGQLSFKLLIDHPAILDYWKRRNETDGSSNVDDVDSPEQQLLRFFAGCEMLTSKTQPIETPPSVAVDEPEPAPTTKAFTFFVFFPNDYSGQDDRANNLAIPYLLNGVGTQYYYNANQGSVRANPDMYPWTTTKGTTIGGYEVRSNGISIVTNPVSNDGKTGNTRSFATTVKHNNSNYYLAKQIGDYKGKRIEWYYRVDNKRRNEKLVLNIDYIDTKSFKLNSGGNQDSIRKTFNISDDMPLYSLTDVYAAITNDSVGLNTLNGCYNEANVKNIKNIIKNYGIKQVTVKGWASSHGITQNVSRNNDLNKNRRDTVLSWLKSMPSFNTNNIDYKPLTGGVGPGPTASNVSDLKPKLYRCAEVTVYVNTEKVSNAKNTVTEKKTSTNSDAFDAASNTQAYNTNNYVSGTTNETPVMSTLTHWPKTNLQFEKGTTFLNSVNTIKTKVNSFKRTNGVNDSNTNAINNKTTTQASTATEVDVKAGKTTNKGAESKAYNEQISDNTIRRYDNEADFFKGLEMNDPFMRQKISEKIKYFDPAFHSISPEGFNARLNFLQQCTRQGPTIGGSDLSDNIGITANNLSFGRPPVCILRIGDFYYTKVIITSLSIDYDPLLWDLNSEGIGVMPMIANVSMSFHFIGGSNLTGPVERLQNALSFNYYANTEVYDDRAEQINYNNQGEIDKFKTFPY